MNQKNQDHGSKKETQPHATEAPVESLEQKIRVSNGSYEGAIGNKQGKRNPELRQLPLYINGRLVDPSTLDFEQVRLLSGLFRFTIMAESSVGGSKISKALAQAFLRENHSFVSPRELDLFFKFCHSTPNEMIPVHVDQYWSTVLYYEALMSNRDIYRDHYGDLIAGIPQPSKLCLCDNYVEHLFGDKFICLTDGPYCDLSEEDDKIYRSVVWGRSKNEWPWTQCGCFIPFPFESKWKGYPLPKPTEVVSWPFTVGIFPPQDGHKIGQMVLSGEHKVASVIVNTEFTTEVLFRLDAAERNEWEDKSAVLKDKLETQGFVTEGYDLSTHASYPSTDFHLVYIG